MNQLVFHINHPDAKHPVMATDGAAGIDLYIIKEDKSYNGVTRYDTGISVEIPKGYTGFLIERSSLHKNQGFTLANKVGVIDSDYRGNIMVCLEPAGDLRPRELSLPDRVVQLIILETPKFDIKIIENGKTEDLSIGGKRTGGFGSTN